jgi:hypothetical protein
MAEAVIATPNFVRGEFTRIRSTIGSDTFSYPGDKWSMSIKGSNKDMSNMRDGRNRQPGLPDAEGSFDLKYDQANDPTVVAKGNLRASAILDVKFCLTAATDSPFYGVKIIIDEITPGADFDKEGTLSVKWSLQSGDVAYPVYEDPGP